MVASQNPLFNSGNKLKLGAFGINGDSNSRTLVPERYRFDWPNSLDVAQQADRLGFEVIVPYARFRSIVSPQHHSGHAFECFSWSAAVSAQTRYSAVMSTVHVTNVNPILAAKAMATIDHISSGRFALNIVCGWMKEEAEMFGTPFLDHDERYAYADEWISAIKRLWTETDAFDFAGKYIQVRRGESQPKPIQKPYPPLMNAGGSPQGRQFVSKHCNIAFVRGNAYDLMKAEAEGYRQAARAFGREIQVWAPCSIVHGDTNEHARELADRYAAHADAQYVKAHFDYINLQLPPEKMAAVKRDFSIGGNGLLLIGDAQRLAQELQRISNSGVDGLLLTWVDHVAGIRKFAQEVLPLLVQAGLRRTVAAPTR